MNRMDSTDSKIKSAEAEDIIEQSIGGTMDDINIEREIEVEQGETWS